LLTPETFDQDETVAVVFPMRRHINGVAPWGQIPVAGRPDITTGVPVPVAFEPDVMTRRTMDDDLVNRRRWWFGNEHLSRSRRLRRVLLPAAWAEGVTVVARFPMRCDERGVGRGRLDPATGIPGVGAISPAPVSRNPYGGREGTSADRFCRWGWRRLADDNFSRVGRSGNGSNSVGVPPVAIDKNVTVIATIPAGGDVDDAFARRQFPTACYPDVTVILPAPATGNPDMAGRRACDNDFVAWCGRGTFYDNADGQTEAIGFG